MVESTNFFVPMTNRLVTEGAVSFPATGWQGFMAGIPIPERLLEAPPSFLAQLIERLRTLDGQLLGVLVGQLPANAAVPLPMGLSKVPPIAPTMPLSAPLPTTPAPTNAVIPLLATPLSGNTVESLLGSREGQTLEQGQQPSSLSGTSPLATLPIPIPSPTPSSSRQGLTLSPIQQLVVQAAQRHGVDPALALAVAKAESNFDHQAVSPKGAMGVMQLMPQTAKGLGVTNPFDPRQNIDGGIRYLRQLIEQFGGNLTLAVAAYNAGPNAVRRYGGVPPYPETQTFVRRVLAYWQEFRQKLTETTSLSSSEQPRQPSDEVVTSSLLEQPRQKLTDTMNYPSPEQTPKVARRTVSASDQAALPFRPPIPSTSLQPQGAVRSQSNNHAQPIVQPLAEVGKSVALQGVVAVDAVSMDAVSVDEPQQPSDPDAQASPQPIGNGNLVKESRLIADRLKNRAEQSEEPTKLQKPLSPERELGEETVMSPENPARSAVRADQGSSLSAPSALTPQTSTSQSSSVAHERTPVVHRLAMEVPVGSEGERLRVQVSLMPNAETPAVQVAVRVSDEQWAIRLNAQLPTLRQHLWEQGIALAQWTVQADGRGGGHRDPANLAGEWRHLPSASPQPLPALLAEPEEGIWA